MPALAQGSYLLRFWIGYADTLQVTRYSSLITSSTFDSSSNFTEGHYTLIEPIANTTLGLEKRARGSFSPGNAPRGLERRELITNCNIYTPLPHQDDCLRIIHALTGDNHIVTVAPGTGWFLTYGSCGVGFGNAGHTTGSISKNSMAYFAQHVLDVCFNGAPHRPGEVIESTTCQTVVVFHTGEDIPGYC